MKQKLQSPYMAVVLAVMTLLLITVAPKSLQEVYLAAPPFNLLSGVFLVLLFWVGLTVGVRIGQNSVLATKERKI